jgi:hypothetical protein
MSDEAIRQQVAEDFEWALSVATEAWNKSKHITEYDMGTIQKAAYTVLSHLQTLRREERLHVTLPSAPSAPANTGGGQSSKPAPRPETRSAAPSIPSACPQCGGELWDNRENKKNPKAPDWKCKDKTCIDAKGFVTAGWLEKPNAKGAKGNAHPVAAGGYDQRPGPLVNEDADDSLPF